MSSEMFNRWKDTIVPPQTHAYSKPKIVTLFGNRVLVDVIKSQDETILGLEWGLNSMIVVFIKKGEDSETHTGTEQRRLCGDRGRGCSHAVISQRTPWIQQPWEAGREAWSKFSCKASRRNLVHILISDFWSPPIYEKINLYYFKPLHLR